MPSCRKASKGAILVLASLALAPSRASSGCPERFDPPPGIIGFGVAAALPGDLNADGWVDVAVGAAALDPPSTGNVLIYFGGPAPDSIPDLVLGGTESGEQFGLAVAGTGDLNGDGAPDLAVGAPGRDSGGSDAGRVYIYLGGPGLDGTADLVLDGTTAYGRFGAAVAGGADLDASGRVDLVVGAPASNIAGAAGTAFVYFGATPLHTTPDRTIAGDFGEHLGTAVALGGDVNQDGVADLAAGAPDYISGGRVKLYWGGPAFDASPDRTLTTGGSGTAFGSAIALADLNGDATTDVLAGAPTANGGYGVAYIFHGGAAADGASDLFIPGTTAGGNHGRFVAAGVDLTGDGWGDFVVGSPGQRVQIYAGGPGLNHIAEAIWPAMGADGFGYAGALGGDFDADGDGDLVVGAPLHSGAGRVWFEPLPCLTVSGPQSLVLQPGLPANLRYCIRSCEAVPRLFTFSFGSSPPGWVVPGSGTVTIAPGDSACFDVAVSTGGSCMASGAVNFSAFASDCTTFVASRQTTVTTVATSALLTCQSSIQTNPSTGLVRTFYLRNNSSLTLTYAYAITDDRGWGPPVAGTVTLAPNDLALYDFDVHTPSVICSTEVDVITFAVDVTGCNDRHFSCMTEVTVPPPAVTLQCPPDTTLIAGVIERRFRWRNTMSYTQRYDWSLSDAQGWGAPASGTVLLPPLQWSTAVFDLEVPALCASAVDTLDFVLYSAVCPTLDLGCDAFVISVAASATPLAAGEILVTAGEPASQPMQWRNQTLATLHYTYSVADELGWGTPFSGSATLAPDEVGTATFVFVPPLGLCAPSPVDVVRLAVQVVECPGFTMACSTTVLASPSGLPDLVVSGPTLDLAPGAALVLGDVTGDGIADLCTGALTAGGAVWMFEGGPSLDGQAEHAYTGEGTGDDFGTAIAVASDVNGDGARDLVIGAPRNDAGGPDAGRVYVHYGGPGLDSAVDRVLSGGFGMRLGASVAGVGDVNADGRDDLLVGAPGSNQARVYFGGSGGFDTNFDLLLSGAMPGEQFGERTAACGDLNGDGHADFAVGAPSNDAGGTDAGRVYVYFGGPGANSSVDLVLDGTGGRFGDVLAGADLDGDGHSDLIVAAPLDAGGRVFLFRGGATLDGVPDLVLDASHADEHFGAAVATGDVDGEELLDLVVGTSTTVPGEPGRVWIYHGGPGFDAACDGQLVDSPGDGFGAFVAAGHDATGDGTPDLLVGALGADFDRRIVVYDGALPTPTDADPPTPIVAAPAATALGYPRDLGTAGTRVEYSLGAGAGRARLEIFDIAGRRVRSLFDAAPPPGRYAALWDRRDDRGARVARGVYLIRLRTDSFHAGRKIVVLRP